MPIFITQHMPPTFTTILAEHISKAGGRLCTEGKDGEKVEAGHVYLAPGDYHMVPEKVGDNVIIRTNQGPQENYCRPAADPMLRALSGIYGKNLLVVVLTGMGQDGMLGAKEVVAAGGSVVAQDEASCVVYGMPKAVVENNLCRAVLPLNEIGKYLLQQIEGR
jgi:two-component system chemotaxis response regulator CheB